MKVRNITAGQRGLYLASGDMLMVEPGQTVDVEVAAGEPNPEWFADPDKLPTQEPDHRDAWIDELTRENARLRTENEELTKLLAAADDKLPSLAGKNKAELLEIAEAEGVEIKDGATNAEIVAANEAKRGN